MRARRVGVLIVDDHEVVRLGLRSLLGREKAIEIVGEAATAEEAVAQAERLRPTVVVMDVRLPDRSGIEACREIRAAAPDTRVIMLTSYADDEAVFASILAGASGYLLKQAGGLDLVRAIERVADGQSLLDPGVTEKVLEKVKRLASGQPDEVTSLSPQEQRVLALVAEGKTNKEIRTRMADVGIPDKIINEFAPVEKKESGGDKKK